VLDFASLYMILGPEVNPFFMMGLAFTNCLFMGLALTPCFFKGLALVPCLEMGLVLPPSLIMGLALTFMQNMVSCFISEKMYVPKYQNIEGISVARLMSAMTLMVS
jgi:hypothetical protein